MSLRSASVHSLCTRAPWKTTNGDLTADLLWSIFLAIETAGDAPPKFPIGGSDRRQDRALQLLRKAGVIHWDGKRWRAGAKP